MDICINGRFLAAPPAATYAVAEHLTRALAGLLAQNPHGEPRSARILVPRGARQAEVGMPAEIVGRTSGNLWEQTCLPLAVKGRLLLNFAARSPFFLRNALTMIHDAQVFTSPASYSPAFRTTLKANIRAAGALQLGVLTVSEFARSELVGLGIAPAERIHVIHNGVDHVLRVPAEDEVLARLNLVPGSYALGLANLQPHKNIALLIRAFSRPDLADLKLVLVGNGSREDFAARGAVATDNVIFTGYVSDGEMRSLQANALAVCTPSLTEGFGLPPVEGLLHGTPAVIAPLGALPEVCGPGALQADPYDPAAWEAALLRLRQEPGLHESLSRQGRDFAARFTWKAAATRLVEVIDTVAPSGG